MYIYIYIYIYIHIGICIDILGILRRTMVVPVSTNQVMVLGRGCVPAGFANGKDLSETLTRAQFEKLNDSWIVDLNKDMQQDMHQNDSKCSCPSAFNLVHCRWIIVHECIHVFFETLKLTF